MGVDGSALLRDSLIQRRDLCAYGLVGILADPLCITQSAMKGRQTIAGEVVDTWYARGSVLTRVRLAQINYPLACLTFVPRLARAAVASLRGRLVGAHPSVQARVPSADVGLAPRTDKSNWTVAVVLVPSPRAPTATLSTILARVVAV